VRLTPAKSSGAVALLTTAVVTATGAVATTWPLARNLGSATLGSGEVLLTAWQLNDYQRAFLTNPLAWADANIFFPYDRAAAFNDLLISHALITLPAAWAESPVLALNLAFLGGIVLCGLFAHLLIVELVDEPWAGAVGGTLFALSPFRFLHVGHLSIAAAWAVPLFFWSVLRHLRDPSPGRGVFVAVSGLLVVLSSLYHAAFVAPLVPLVLLFAARRGENSRRAWLPLVLTGAPALALAVSFLVPFAAVVNDHGIGAAPEDLVRFGADLSSLGQKPAFLDGSASTSRIGPEAHLYPGTALAWLAVAGLLVAVAPVRRLDGWQRSVTIVILLLVGLIALGFAVPRRGAMAPLWRTGVLALVWIGPAALAVWAIATTRASAAVGHAVAIRFGLAGAALAFAFALGPEARHLGRLIGPAPYGLLTRLSEGFAGTRVPARFGGLVLLFLAIIAGGVIAAMLRAPRRAVRGAGAAVVVAALAACVIELPVPPLPGGQTLVTLPKLADPVYDWLAGRPGRFGVLELPDWPPEAEVHYQHREWRSLRHMLAAKQHGQHLVNGAGRVEPFLWHRLRWHEPWSDGFFSYIAAYLPAHYVLVHEGGIPQESRAAVWSRLDRGTDGWQPMFRSSRIRLYRVDRSFGRGPMIDRLLQRRELAPGAEVRFSARAVRSADQPGELPTAITLEFLRDGEVITTFAIGPEWKAFHVTVPVTAVPGQPTGEWPRTGTLFRWQVRGQGVHVDLKDLSVSRLPS
jgi:hypothetical protein